MLLRPPFASNCDAALNDHKCATLLFWYWATRPGDSVANSVTTCELVGSSFTSEELNELPTSSHVVTLFATLSPGLVAQYQNNNVAHLWSFNAASQFEANGGRNNIYSIS